MKVRRIIEVRILSERVARLVLTAFLLIFFLHSSLLHSLDPRRPANQYTVDVWGTEEGLPQNSVVAIFQGRSGYLWLGTEEGLARFDGVGFEVYSRYTHKEIKNNWISSVIEHRPGELLVGTYGDGLFLFKNGAVTPFPPDQSLSNDKVWGLYKDKQGALWIGTEGGLNRYQDGVLTVYGTAEGLSHNVVCCISEDAGGNLWVGTEGGLNRFKNGEFTVYTTRDGLSNNYIWSMLIDRHGALWLGTYGGGVNRFNAGGFTSYTTDQGLPGNFVRSIYEDRQGNLWVGTDGGGLTHLDPGSATFTRFSDHPELSGDTVTSLYEDPEGSLWIGTDGGGLHRLKSGKFINLSTEQGLSNNIVDAVYEDRRGNLWIGTYGGGVNRYKDGEFTVYTTKEGLSDNYVWSFYEDRAGDLWVGASGGLNRFRDGKITVYPLPKDLPGSYVWDICEDRAGNLWLGVSGGVLRAQRPANGNGPLNFTVYSTKDGLPGNSVGVVFEDSRGALWVGSDGGGLSRFLPPEVNGGVAAFTNYTTREGLAGNNVNAVYEDREAGLWICTYQGLSRLKNGVLKSITVADGLFNDGLFKVMEDDRGNFWLSCNRGVFQVPKQQLDDFCDGKRSRVHCIVYDNHDGMISRECNGGYQAAGCKTRDGMLWFPTIRGVTGIDPSAVHINRIPPPMRIAKVLADDVSLPLSYRPDGTVENAVLPAGSLRFEIHYAGLSFLVPKRVKFKYKLEGFDKQWREVGTRRTAYYTKIPPGRYTFQVTACNNDGIWNETGASLALHLKPYYYQTSLFKWLMGLAVLLSVLGLVRWRVRDLKKHRTELQLLVGERTRQLEDSNRALKKAVESAEREKETARTASQAKSEFLARMSHEIRTPINGIMGFTDILMGTSLDEEQRDCARTISYSGNILSSLVNDIFDFSRSEMGAMVLNPVAFDLEVMAGNVIDALRSRLEDKPIDLSYHIGSEVPRYLKGDAARYRQVLINLGGNAVKFTEQGYVTLSFEMKGQIGNRLMLQATVRDTGIGMSEDMLGSAFEAFHQADGSMNREYGGSGLGLPLSRRIARLMEGDVRGESTPGKGSVFHFTAWLESVERPVFPVKQQAKYTPPDVVAPAPQAVIVPKTQTAPKTEMNQTPREPETQHRHILLVEDHPVNRKLVSSMLKKTGYRVTEAENGEEAVEAFIMNPGAFDAVIMDIQMPKMNGLEATKTIRELEAAEARPLSKTQPPDETQPPHIPIIAVTAQNLEGDREKCLAAGMDDYIAKPIRKKKIIEILQKWAPNAGSP